MPYRYPENCVVYTGTHDNQPLAAWYEEMSEEDRALARDYLALDGKTREETVWAFIRLALACKADTCMIPMQDYLCKDGSARINKPSTIGNNWCWRLGKEEFTEKLQEKIRRLTEVYGRLSNGSVQQG